MDMNARLREAAGILPTPPPGEEAIPPPPPRTSIDGGSHSPGESDPYPGAFFEPADMNERIWLAANEA